MSAGRGRILLLAAGGAAVAGVVLFIASQMDDAGDRRERPSRLDDAVELVNPAPLTDDERRGGRPLSAQPLAELERGAWVQVTDENGRLAQQFNAQHVEPLPDRRLRLDSPHAIFYREDGRVIVLQARRGEARVPGKALESGRLQDDVVIRMFRPGPGGVVDVSRDEPVLTIETQDATFDNVLGEVRCEGEIEIASVMGSFAGVGLELRVAERGGAGATGDAASGIPSDFKAGSIERLVVERCTRPIVLVRGEDGTTRASGATAAPSMPPGAAPAPAPSGGAAQAAPHASPVYRLTLFDDVRVRRDRAGRVTTLRGDELIARFTLDGAKGLDSLAEGDAVVAPSPLGAMAATSFASVPPAGDAGAPGEPNAPRSLEETITIEYAGRLVLEPETDAGVTLASPDDVRVELVARPKAPGAERLGEVTLDDAETLAHVTCDRLAFEGSDDLVEAFGTEERPLRVVSPRLKASGQRFFLRRGQGKGGFSGAGEIELASGGESFAALAIAPSAGVVSRDADGDVALALPAAGAQPSSVTIGWATALDLDFVAARPGGVGAADADEGALRSASFSGNVTVAGDGFALESDLLTASFGADGATVEGAAPLDRIVAKATERESVVARRTDGTPGELQARSLDLTLVPGTDDNPAPSRLEAVGAVAARDAKQAIYGERLVATFAESQAAPLPDAQRSPTDFGRDIALIEMVGAAAAGAGRAEEQEGPGDLVIDLFGAPAEGPDGVATPRTRVFADRLNGDQQAQRLEVTGNDIWVVRDLVLADQLTNISFDGATRSATSLGQGRVRTYGQPFEMPLGPASRPAIPTNQQLVAEWSERFRFDERDETTGRPLLALAGAVRVRNTPDRSSTDALDAERLRLELDEPTGKVTGASGSAADALGARAAVRAVEAMGHAVIESRSWATEAREGIPRLFKLAGEHVRYDTVSREGWVDGAGSLLMYVPERTSDRTGGNDAAQAAGAPADTASAAVAGPPISFGAEGTTQFKWGARLDLTHVEGDRYRVVMRDDVQVAHDGPRPGDAGSAQGNATAPRTDWLVMTAPYVEALVLRPQAGEAGAAARVDLGGTARLERVLARGDAHARLLIKTNAFDLHCDEIDYSVVTGIAVLKADPGQLVKVLEHGKAQPLQAEIVEWDLATGRISIRGAEGALPR